MQQSASKLPFVPLGQNDLVVIEHMLANYERFLITVLPPSENREAWVYITQTLRRRIGSQLLALRQQKQVALTLFDYEAVAIDSALMLFLQTLRTCLPQCLEVKKTIKACEDMRKAMAPLRRSVVVD